MRRLFLLLLSVVLCSSCENGADERNENKSMLLLFQDLGTADTVCAKLSGEIYQRDEKGDTIPLSGARVVISDEFQDFETDSRGYFVSCIRDGAKEIEVTKDGFQTAIIENYVAKSGQISGFKLLLERGDEDVILKIKQN